MRLGEVCLLTNDVPRLATFYKELLDTDNGSTDPVHQFIISGDVSLTVYNDGTDMSQSGQTICLAFTVDDLESEYQKLLALGAEIVEPPAKRPWGAINLSFRDPDGNLVYLRQLPEA
ncbi:MAG: VOC family protein [Clostridia bacterium]|nr:VOC family protein [Clostridia bacterium]